MLNNSHQAAASSRQKAEENLLCLLRVALGMQERIPAPLESEDWNRIFDQAGKQSVTGIAALGISRLPDVLQPGYKEKMQWLQTVCLIVSHNEKLSAEAVAVSDFFKSKGMPGVILKGQSLAVYYPEPEYRMSGDIDVWVKAPVVELARLSRSMKPDCKFFYHHTDIRIPGIDLVEPHFRPSWMFNPFHNARLQKYFTEMGDSQFGNQMAAENGSFAVPTTEFNRIFLLVHIYRHVFFEGIGLRQFIDYFYVLRAGTSEEEKKETVAVLRRLGLLKFCGGVMYVLKYAFRLEDRYLLTAPDSRRGRLLLKETLRGGNFGIYDDRVDRKAMASSATRWIERIRHDCRFAIQYPSEAIWATPFRIWQKLWAARLEKRIRI